MSHYILETCNEKGDAWLWKWTSVENTWQVVSAKDNKTGLWETEYGQKTSNPRKLLSAETSVFRTAKKDELFEILL